MELYDEAEAKEELCGLSLQGRQLREAQGLLLGRQEARSPLQFYRPHPLGLEALGPLEHPLGRPEAGSPLVALVAGV